MLQLSILGMAFSVVFYIVFGLSVKFMTLSNCSRNKARLCIVVSSILVFSISSVFAAIYNFSKGNIFYGITVSILTLIGMVILISIFVELHNINTRIKMRNFMILFDIVDRFMTEGKTQEEIMLYLIQIQKLTKKEAREFLKFITDPTNYQFLSDVNAEIHAAHLLGK
jgi:ATP-dependent Zn protease